MPISLILASILGALSVQAGPAPSEPKKAKVSEEKKAPLIQPHPGFSSIVSEIIWGVVNISTTQIIEPKIPEAQQGQDSPFGTPFDDLLKDFFRGFAERERPRRVHGLGSGFFIHVDRNKAYIVTNYHVIGEAKKISIHLYDKTEIEATLHAFDERTDIAVLKVDLNKIPLGKREKIRILQWGNSDRAQVGDWVLAVGSPFGLGSSVTAGIISSKGRDLILPGRGRVTDYVDDFIQHSAQINMGNSGGCLINMEGHVLGINTAIVSQSGGHIGIGFAIPAAVAKNTVDQLIKSLRTKRGWLGVRVQVLNKDMAESLGLKAETSAIVGSVNPSSPAQSAGILPGDVILEFNEKCLNEENRLSRLVGETPVGSRVPVKIWRRGHERIIYVVVGEFEKGEKEVQAENAPGKKQGQPQAVQILGLTLTSVTEDIIRNFALRGVRMIPKGILVKRIDPTSFASEFLRPGDIIESVHVQDEKFETRQPIDFEKAVTKARSLKKNNILLLVFRGGEPHYISIRVDAPEAKKQGKR